jgi:hypothetical protein
MPDQVPADVTISVESIHIPYVVEPSRGKSAAEVEACVSRRIDFYDDPGAPDANSLVPSVNVVVANHEGSILLIRRTDSTRLEELISLRPGCSGRTTWADGALGGDGLTVTM